MLPKAFVQLDAEIADPPISDAQLDAEIAEALRAHEWQAQVARDERARRARQATKAVDPSPRQLHEEHQADVAAGLFHGEKRGRASQFRRKFLVSRQPERETRTRDNHPGLPPPLQGDLSIGRTSESWKPLYWKKLLATHAQETSRTAHDNVIALDLWIAHAPDNHTPFARLGWPDPLDVRGAKKAARKLIEEGRAQFAAVHARASRPHSHGHAAAAYTLASFARNDAGSPR
jgi:hypothetical protein